MDVTKILLEILVLLVAAKAAAEIAERIGVPAVVGEIIAGVVIGPSLLGWVHESDVLRTLGELGVILLLLEVGLEMDLAGLARVGRASLLVATVGVIVPFVAGFGTAELLGAGGNEALFIGAALTATSVGITARVFGDLRALGTIEARTVLGAAVADDVMGLVVLTVVVKIVTQGSVSVWSVLGTVVLAVGFLAIAVPLGRALAPPVFSTVARFSRSNGTLVAIALAFTLGMSELAHSAGLAPIIGAFVAGIALTAAPPAPKIRRELAPIGHVFVPVFFLQIGIEADVAAFGNGEALALAGALLAVGIVGKLVASAGMLGAAGDKLLVGIGMIPRGEVGLIFATIGLREKVFGETTFAALLIVVLATTLVTPPVLRMRLAQLQRRARGDASAKERAVEHLDIADATAVSLAEEPPSERALAVAVAAARAVDRRVPSEELLEWVAALPPGVRRIDDETRDELFAVLDEGQARSWNFLVSSGALARLLPELAEALERRTASAMDPIAALELVTIARARESDLYGTLVEPQCVLIAAVALDAVDGTGASAVAIARRTAARLGLDVTGQERCATLVRDCMLLDAAARRPDALSEPNVVGLAVHIGTSDDARALQVLTHAACGDADPEDGDRIDALADAIVAALQRPELAGGAAAEAERRIVAASSSVEPDVATRLASTPPAFVLAIEPEELRATALLTEPKPARNEVRVGVEATRVGWVVTFAARDRVGLIARQTGALLGIAASVDSALAATWPDGVAVARYVVRTENNEQPDAVALADRVRDAMVAPLAVAAVPGAELTFDDESSPTWTRCRIEARQRVGLLHALASAFAAADVSIHSASIVVDGSRATEEFEVCDSRGRKLDSATRERVAAVLSSGTTVRAGGGGRSANWRR